jgi:hypothetical protein
MPGLASSTRVFGATDLLSMLCESATMTRPGKPVEREECIEQAYFFRNFRERIEQNIPAQESLGHLSEQLLTTTRLPMAVQFLSTELKHTGLLSTGFAKLPHYFTTFQTYLIKQSEEDKVKFTINTGLLALEREALYKSATPTQAGLFVYQFETLARNKLGYDQGLLAASKDPFFDSDWSQYIDTLRRQVGVIDFADLVYIRSELYVLDQRRNNPDYVPRLPPLFGEKEGKIAKASRGKDPLFLFAALQRQLDYPEVPRVRAKAGLEEQFEKLQVKLREMEARLRMLESEMRGTFDPTQFGKPDLFKDDED